jgi:hypothetical protein
MACVYVHRADGSTVLGVYLHVRRDVMHIPGDTDVGDQVHCAESSLLENEERPRSTFNFFICCESLSGEVIQLAGRQRVG